MAKIDLDLNSARKKIIPFLHKRKQWCKKQGMKPLSYCCYISYALLFVLVIMGCSACGNGDENSGAAIAPQISPSFSFFDVGVNTPYSRTLRSSLQNVLGDDAISSRNTIDLQINTDGFLAKYFPQLHKLSTSFNDPFGERVEHDTIKLTYRYAVKKDLPFDYVELLFSQYSHMPMIIRVFFEKDRLDVLSSLKAKYGDPGEFPWKQPNGKSLYWEKNGDVLFYSYVPNQFGVPEYQVTIYFTRRLQELLEKEQRGKGTGVDNQPASTGKAVF